MRCGGILAEEGGDRGNSSQVGEGAVVIGVGWPGETGSWEGLWDVKKGRRPFITGSKCSFKMSVRRWHQSGCFVTARKISYFAIFTLFFRFFVFLANLTFVRAFFLFSPLPGRTDFFSTDYVQKTNNKIIVTVCCDVVDIRNASPEYHSGGISHHFHWDREALSMVFVVLFVPGINNSWSTLPAVNSTTSSTRSKLLAVDVNLTRFPWRGEQEEMQVLPSSMTITLLIGRLLIDPIDVVLRLLLVLVVSCLPYRRVRT